MANNLSLTNVCSYYIIYLIIKGEVLHKTSMKEIVRYKKKNMNSYVVTFSDCSVILYDDVIIKHELLLKKKLSDKEYEEILKENKALASYYEGVSFLSRKERTEKEVVAYLKKKEYGKESIENAITRLKEENLLNEERYVDCFLKGSIKFSTDGPGKIKRKLLDLGIQEDLIEKELSCIDDSVWLEKVQKLVDKKVSSNHKDSVNALKQKLGNYLYQKGYSKEYFTDVLDSFNIKNSYELLEKEKNKLVQKLSRKYARKELEFQVKRKLYQKGFSKEEIDEVMSWK